MKKTHSSPSVSRMVQELERRHEQSTKSSFPPKSASTTPASQRSQRSPRTRDKEQRNTTTQESEALYAMPAPQRPQRPPRARDKELSNNTATQESGAYATPTPQRPQRPPRARDKELSKSAATQESEALYAMPAPQRPQRPPRARDKELSKSAATQESEALYAMPAPPKPPRTRNSAQSKSTATQKSETVYAELEIKAPPLMRNGEKSNAATQKDETIYTTVALSRVSTSIPKEELIQKIKNNILVQGCKDEIKNLSQTVYGNSDIFQTKLEEIEKNPSLGTSLSWQVATNPKLVASLAGKKVLGIKNQARKEAEKNISSLCFAIENYAETVKQAKENILQGNLAEQIHHKHSLDLKQMAEDLQKPRKSEQTRLSHKELAHRVKSNTVVQYCHAEVIYWCTVAYGDPRILEYRLEEIQKSPAIGEELAWQVKTHPHSFGKLSGYSIYGFKNDARIQAENALTRLGEAIEGYAEAIKHAKEHIIESEEEKHKRYTQSSEQEKNVQRQQSLSKPPQHPERSPADRQQEAVEAAMQAEWNRLGARPRTATTPQKPAVQHRQESVLPTSQAEQKHHEQKTQKEQTAENQQKSFTAAKEKIPPLSHKEISDRVQNDHSVQRAQIEIYNWCNIVYKDPFILRYNTEDVQKIPVLGEELSWQVANQPTMFAPLAGKQVLGIKNQARKYAEGAVPSLCAAIDDYTKTVQKVREEIIKTHQEQSPERDKSMQKQKSLSQSPQLSERSSVKKLPESAENSTQVHKNSPDVHQRKVSASKAMALTS